MQYYLVRLCYTAAAWQELIYKNPPTNLDDRLDNVRALVKSLGGSFATYEFRELPKSEVVIHKFIPIGEHDIVTILAMPDNVAARSFVMAVSAEDGVKSVEVTPMIPLEEGIRAMHNVRAVTAKVTYTAPGRSTK